MTVKTSFTQNALSASRWPILAFLISAFMLCGAYAFEHIGGLAPCQMCYWQRHAHKLVMVVSLLAIAQSYFIKNAMLRHVLSRLFLWLISAAFLVSFAYGFAHMGVEFGWWEGPKSCMVTPGEIFSAGDLMESLKQKIDAPACSDVKWSFLGLSMAAWNALISLLAAILSLRFAYKGPAR
jgi:disulfide bond formation protein DsbB